MADAMRAPTSLAERRQPAESLGPREFLSFRLDADTYAVALAGIREIVSPPPVTEVPRAAPDVIGICSVRGLLVTVIDLRRRLRLPEAPPSRLSRILLANTEPGEVVGLFVDEVRQVVRLGASELELTANVLGGDLADHVLGVGRPDGDFVVLLDLNRIVGT